MVENQEGKTKMVAASGKTFIQAIRPIRLKSEMVVQEGQCAEVSEEEAREFCDRTFQGNYPFTGTAEGANASAEKIVRAKRITAEEAKKIQATQPAAASSW